MKAIDLNNTLGLLSSAISVEELLHALCKVVKDVFNADHSCVIIFDPNISKIEFFTSLDTIMANEENPLDDQTTTHIEKALSEEGSIIVPNLHEPQVLLKLGDYLLSNDMCKYRLKTAQDTG
jgi:hypothetical protein